MLAWRRCGLVIIKAKKLFASIAAEKTRTRAPPSDQDFSDQAVFDASLGFVAKGTSKKCHCCFPSFAEFS